MAYRFSPMSQFILPVQQPVAAVPGNFAQNAIMREQLAENQRQALAAEEMARRQQMERERAAAVAEGLDRQIEQRARQKQNAEVVERAYGLGKAGLGGLAEASLRASGMGVEHEMVPSEQERQSWAGSMAGQMMGMPVSTAPVPPPQERTAITYGGERLGELDLAGAHEKGADEIVKAFRAAASSDPNIPPGSQAVIESVGAMAPHVLSLVRQGGGKDQEAVEMLLDLARSRINSLGNVRQGGGGGGRRGGQDRGDLYKVSQTVRSLVTNNRIRTGAPKLLERRNALSGAERLLNMENPIADRQTIMDMVRTANGGRPTDKDLGYFTGAGSLWLRVENQLSQTLGTGTVSDEFRKNMLELLGEVKSRLDQEDEAAVQQIGQIASSDVFIRDVFRDDPEGLRRVAESAKLQAGQSAESGSESERGDIPGLKWDDEGGDVE